MLKKLPLKGSTKGQVYAIRIASNRWGFVRFRSYSGFGVLPVYSQSPGLPRIVWNDDVEKWFAWEFSGPEKYDTDDYIPVGERAFVDADRSFMPDMYQKPHHPWQPWIVFRRGQAVRVDGPEDVVGILEEQRLSAGELKQFIHEKYAAGELTEVDVESIQSAS